jgi:hypothetical protein
MVDDMDGLCIKKIGLPAVESGRSGHPEQGVKLEKVLDYAGGVLRGERN